MTIHKEGRSLLIILLVLLTGLNYGIYTLFPESGLAFNISLILSSILYLTVLQFFRKPRVEVVKGENLVIAPADGKVVVIENTIENEHFKDNRKQISIFMSPVNVHNNRFPVGGIVKKFTYHPGKYLMAWHPKASTDNERTTMVLEHPKHGEVLVRQIAGALARRICWYTKDGEAAKQSEEYGFIKFGSRVDIYLPTSAKILVDLEQKTVGGKTVIAEF